MVDEATVDIRIDTVKGNNRMRSEETIEEQANNPSDGMFRKKVQRIVNLNKDLNYNNGKQQY